MFGRIHLCALIAAGALFIDSQALAQGGPDVTAVNTPLPVTVTNQPIPGTPVTFALGITPPNNFYTVPADQQLVIEYVSGQCSGLQNPGLLVNTGGGNSFFHSVEIPTLGTPTPGVNVEFGHLVKLYAGAGTKVAAIANNGSSSPPVLWSSLVCL